MTLRPMLLTCAGLALLAATGCRTVTGGSCHQPQAYESAGNLPPLRVPTGLDAPDTTGALLIPELDRPELPLDPEGPCLDAPPALTEPPPPPSEVVLPGPDDFDDADDAGPQASAGEPRPERSRRRPPRRPR